MRFKKKYLFGPLVLALFVSCGLLKQQKNEDIVRNAIVGKWVSTNRSEGGLGGMYIFGKNENVFVFYGAITDYKYTIDGRKIIETYADGTQTISYYAIEGNNFTKELIYPKNFCSECRLQMKRIGQDVDKSPTVIGNWTYKNKIGAWAIQEYTSNGKAQLYVPLATEKGKYQLMNNQLTIEIEGKKPVLKRFRIEKNRLVLNSSDGSHEEIYQKSN